MEILQAKKSNSPPPSVRTRRATAAAALMEEERDAPKSISKLASPNHSKVEKPEKSWSLTGRLSTLSKVIQFVSALLRLLFGDTERCLLMWHRKLCSRGRRLRR